MNYWQLRKFKKLYHIHSEHVESFDFRKAPFQLRKDISEEDFNKILDIPFMRIEEDRKILVNESANGYQDLLEILIIIDKMPDIVLKDLFSLYSPKYKRLKVDDIMTFNDNESWRRLFFILMIEILWSHGEDNIKSKCFIE